MCCLARKTLKCNSLVRKFVYFFKNSHHTAKAVLHRCVPKDLNTIFFVTTFTWKMPESSDSMYSIYSMIPCIHARKHMISSFYLKWTEFTRYCKFWSNCQSQGTRTKSVQIRNLLWIRFTLGKMMVSYVFSH